MKLIFRLKGGRHEQPICSLAGGYLGTGLRASRGAIIGLNRWLYHKPAGLGTHGLVALGATPAVIVATGTPGADAAAAGCVIQGLVTAVGFIGAGVIMRENAGQ